MLDVPFRSATRLAAMIRKRTIGCLELLDLYLARIDTIPSSTRSSRLTSRARAGAPARPTGRS